VQTQSLIPSFEDTKLHSADSVAADVVAPLSSEIKAIEHLANPLLCDEKYLPYLAYAFKVDLWDGSLSTQNKRDLIVQSLELHRKKGTRWAILEVLKAVGLSVPNYEAVIVEYKDRDDYKFDVKRNGSYSYNSVAKHNDGLNIYDFVFTNWTDFAVIIKTSISESQAVLAKKLIEIYKPVRCTLIGFVFDRKQRNGVIFYDSLHTHGVV
jgi:phage tail P2-like protein